MKDRLKETYRTAKAHSKFSDSPWERLGGLFLRMLSHPTLPNVMLGGWFASLANVLVNPGGDALFAVNTLFLLLSFAIYAVGDDVSKALKAASQGLDEGNSPGIE